MWYAYIDETLDHVWDVYEISEDFEWLMKNWSVRRFGNNETIQAFTVVKNEDKEELVSLVEVVIDALNRRNVELGLIKPFDNHLQLEVAIAYFGPEMYMCDFDCENCFWFDSISLPDSYVPVDNDDEIPF